MELRTAYLVAELGTVSAAAASLGVHRATVTRQIDTLEAALGARLFLRHARGFTPTDAGRDMLDVARRADESFRDLEGRSKGRSGKLSGELVVTSLAGIAPLAMPAARLFAADHPEIEIRFLASEELARLEFGEAHVALRVGPAPQEPDYVVTQFTTIRFGLYAHRTYLARHGMPRLGGDLTGHRFAGNLESVGRAPQGAWLAALAPDARLGLRSTNQHVVRAAVAGGLGIGLLGAWEAASLPDLVEIAPPSEARSVPVWIVTHVDLTRTAKVREFVRCLKAASVAQATP